MTKNRKFVITAVLLLLAAAGLLAAAQPGKVTPAPDKPAESFEARFEHVPGGFDRRKQAIEDKLAAGGNPAWAGHYAAARGLNDDVDLVLAPDAGAMMTWFGFFGLQAANHGAVVEGSDGVIRISFVAPNHMKYPYLTDELVPVAWGERQYLIPIDRIAEFVSAINHGEEPRHSDRERFLLRAGDAKKPVPGLPALSLEMQARIRRVSVDVTVVSVEILWRKEDNGCASLYRIRVEPVTKADPPLFVGEQLTIPKRRWEFDDADIVAVHGVSADAQIYAHGCGPTNAPKPGDKLVTGAYEEEQRANAAKP